MAVLKFVTTRGRSPDDRSGIGAVPTLSKRFGAPAVPEATVNTLVAVA